MAASSNELNNRLQIRSFSLPSQLNPINKRIEDELEKLQIKEASASSPAERISIGLSGLADLYACINGVLCLPLTQQALSIRQHEKHVGELLKGCSNLHNVCSSVKEIVLQQKKLAKEQLSVLSVHGEDSAYYQSKVATYTCSRKEIIKKAKGLISSLKELIHDDQFGSWRLFDEEDHRLSKVIKALTCVSIINISVIESLLVFLSRPVSKSKAGSLVSKLIYKSKHQGKTDNELTNVEFSLHNLCHGVNPEKVQIAQKRLEELTGVLEGTEKALDSAFIQLTETKACLMNIISF